MLWASEWFEDKNYSDEWMFEWISHMIRPLIILYVETLAFFIVVAYRHEAKETIDVLLRRDHVDAV